MYILCNKFKTLYFTMYVYCDHSTTHTLNDEAYSSCFISQEKSKSSSNCRRAVNNNDDDMVQALVFEGFSVSLDLEILD